LSISEQVGSTHLDKNFNITCTDDGRNIVKGLCDGSSDVSNYFQTQEKYADLLMSMNDVRKYVGSYDVNGHTSKISLYYPYKNGDDHCNTISGHGFMFNRNEFCIRSTSYDKNMVVAHEMGHILMSRLLFPPEDGACSLSDCEFGHDWTLNVDEKCAVSEGWADFVSAVTYFDDDAVYPFYRYTDDNLEGDTEAGNSSALACANNSSSPHKCEGNAARYFWDLYDSTTEGDDSNDVLDLALFQIKNIWHIFNDGTNDLQDCESDDDGRNAWDYYAYGMYYSIDSEDVLRQNCLEDQDTN